MKTKKSAKLFQTDLRPGQSGDETKLGYALDSFPDHYIGREWSGNETTRSQYEDESKFIGTARAPARNEPVLG